MPDNKEKWQQQTCKDTAVARSNLGPRFSWTLATQDSPIMVLSPGGLIPWSQLSSVPPLTWPWAHDLYPLSSKDLCVSVLLVRMPPLLTTSGGSVRPTRKCDFCRKRPMRNQTSFRSWRTQSYCGADQTWANAVTRWALTHSLLQHF